MTIVVEAPELEQVKKQLHKLINVVKINDLDPERSVEREIMIVRVSVKGDNRASVLEIATIFKATAIDVGTNSLTFQVTGTPAKLNDFLELIRPYGVVDMAKSGRIALSREAKSRKLKTTA
jgi:acetolactate synthase-1/3 small subunit